MRMVANGSGNVLFKNILFKWNYIAF